MSKRRQNGKKKRRRATKKEIDQIVKEMGQHFGNVARVRSKNGILRIKNTKNAFIMTDFDTVIITEDEEPIIRTATVDKDIDSIDQIWRLIRKQPNLSGFNFYYDTPSGLSQALFYKREIKNQFPELTVNILQ